MHPYLQKLIDQGWISTHKYQFLDKDQWMVRLKRASNRKLSKKYRYQKQKQGIINHIIKLTSYLSEETPFFYRIRILRFDLKKDDVLCPVCKNIRKTNHKNLKTFQMTCGKKDEEHQKYIKSNISRIRSELWNKRSIAEKENIERKKRETFIKKYGVDNPSKREKIITRNYNKQFFKKLNKEFIEENYITPEGYFLSEKFCNDLGCSKTTSFNILRKFNIEYKKQKGQSNFEYFLIIFLRTIKTNIEIIHGSKKIIAPYELDIYLPEYDLAIEFNGDLFHSAGYSNWSAANKSIKIVQKNQQLKRKYCADKNIDLIQIPEWWWKLDRKFWEELIAWKLGIPIKYLAHLEPWLKESKNYWNPSFGNPPEEVKNININEAIILPEVACSLSSEMIILEQWLKESKRLYFM